MLLFPEHMLLFLEQSCTSFSKSFRFNLVFVGWVLSVDESSWVSILSVECLQSDRKLCYC
jgi:hypothetical protein